MSEVKLEDIVSLAKRRGFIYQGSEVYGGLSGTWDYGPLGVALKRNIMNLWWQTFVDSRDDMYGVDAAILMNQKVWQASGHVDTFTDPLVECSNCHNRFRADHLAEDVHDRVEDVLRKPKPLTEQERAEEAEFIRLMQPGGELFERNKAVVLGREVMDYEKLHKDPDYIVYSERVERINSKLSPIERNPLEIDTEYLSDPMSVVKYAKCPSCGKEGTFGAVRQFNMMFKTNVGPVDDESSISYLRPETAQGIFTNYKNIIDSFYPDLPFGIAQQGKAFRNEISPRDFIFRSREFEQMEIEYFVYPEKWEEAFEQWIKDIRVFLEKLGLPADKIHQLEVPENDRAHYSKRTIDFEFDFPIGREELLGLAYRTDFDLANIQRASGKSMEYIIKGTNDKLVPHVIEPSFGLERAIMAVLSAAYTEDEINGEKRTYLKLPEHLAPVKYAVSPLLKNKPELVEKAREVYRILKEKHGAVMWDDNGNIGKRYRRQDEIGTPHCVTIDFQTLEDDTVTVRDRDTAQQERAKISDIK